MINIFDLYTDYLKVSLGLATATNLSKIVDNAVSHDQDGCLIFDDSIVNKPYTDENEINCWHHDHISCRNTPHFAVRR